MSISDDNGAVQNAKWVQPSDRIFSTNRVEGKRVTDDMRTKQVSPVGCEILVKFLVKLPVKFCPIASTVRLTLAYAEARETWAKF